MDTHLLVRTVACLEGMVELELICEPAFDYGRAPAKWTKVVRAKHHAVILTWDEQ